jgi:hypothetical protein
MIVISPALADAIKRNLENQKLVDVLGIYTELSKAPLSEITFTEYEPGEAGPQVVPDQKTETPETALVNGEIPKV